MSNRPTGICQGYCEEEIEVPLYDDHRRPPMDVEPCLCIECFKHHAEEAIEELENEIEIIRDDIKRAVS
jgi:hypothetical protein